MMRNEGNMERNERNMSNMQKYLVLVKLNPSTTLPFFNALNNIAERPMEGIKIDASYNLFGTWDFAVWFEADSNDNAIHFVGEKIRSIEGVSETLTMPATTLKEFRM
jgi:uncharacterized protein with GYD domain